MSRPPDIINTIGVKCSQPSKSVPKAKIPKTVPVIATVLASISLDTLRGAGRSPLLRTRATSGYKQLILLIAGVEVRSWDQRVVTADDCTNNYQRGEKLPENSMTYLSADFQLGWWTSIVGGALLLWALPLT